MTAPKPTLIYDGDCGFCRAWIKRWRAWAAGAAEARPAQAGGHGLSEEQTARAVWLLTPDGGKYCGAQAVYRTLALAPGSWGIWLKLYEKAPPFRLASEAGYAFIAGHRPLFSKLTRLLFGEHTEPSTYAAARGSFLKGLGLCYAIAFVSFWFQLEGLIGDAGITPAVEFLNRVGQALPGAGKYWKVPTLLWLTPTAASLHGLCAAGVAGAALLLAGLAQIPALLLCWAAYLSLCSVSSPWLNYQWDILLLETGLAALLIAPWGLRRRAGKADAPPRLGVFVLHFLLFKLMFSSGMVKLLSGDPAWRDLTALSYHYETQCLPTWFAWFVHQLPAWAHKISTGIMFFVELCVPFLFFAPRRARMTGGLLTIGLMLIVVLTGNYTFFNWLTVALCLLLFDDAFWRRRLPDEWTPARAQAAHGVEAAPAVWRSLRTACGAALLAASLGAQLLTLGWPAPLLGAWTRVLAPLRSANTYGLFAVMTKERREIVLEGTRDGRSWKTYAFKWKPGDPERAPGFVAPHQPRLDWQLWFAVLSPYDHPRNQWFFAFARRLLQGEPAVSGLLARDPFAGEPPRALRARVFRYRFSSPEVRRRTGQWWVREELGLFCPPLSLPPAR